MLLPEESDLFLGGGRKKPIPYEDKSREQLIHEAKEWRKVAGAWRGEYMEELNMREHELRVRTRTLVLFWSFLLVSCMGFWALVIYLIARCWR
mgnify:CR=1 FL=1